MDGVLGFAFDVAHRGGSPSKGVGKNCCAVYDLGFLCSEEYHPLWGCVIHSSLLSCFVTLPQMSSMLWWV